MPLRGQSDVGELRTRTTGLRRRIFWPHVVSRSVDFSIEKCIAAFLVEVEGCTS